MTRLLIAGLLAVAVAMPAVAQDKKPAPATIKLLVPDKPTRTEVTIEGKKQDEPTDVKDGMRVFTTPDLEPGKTYEYKIEAVVVPNNYTRITRTRTVTFKAGETVEVDVRKEDPKNKDAIVVRWVPTPDDIVDKMCDLAKVTKDDVIHDYGCGDAVMLIRPIQKFGAKKGFGNDIDPKMVVEAKKKIKEAKLEDKITVVEGDILKMTEKDCGEATVVLLYIGDDLGAKLSPVLQKALSPGARVVSHRFTLGDWKPNKTIEVKGEDGDAYTLHLWIVPAKK
ncbi:MAG TPA: TIGR03000 domain-containing protein [Gemmataceae bacterium]|jgi:uncharacterized protein (TIGR03000 family)|nr:TIGR03000 domain-containing protein [Gemmataceae bacterium]